MPVSNRLNHLSALIVQDSIFRLPGWGARLAQVESGFVLLRFPGGLADLLQISSHFDLSIGIIEANLLGESAQAGEGIPQRLRRTLRPIARIDGTEPAAELERLLLLGCYGFIRDHVSRPSLWRILRMVGAGEIVAPRKLLSGALQRLLAGSGAAKLTNREQEVLWLLGQQLSNRRIAERLFISEQTLRWHIRNVYAKTELASREELVEYARVTAYHREPEDFGAHSPDDFFKVCVAGSPNS